MKTWVKVVVIILVVVFALVLAKDLIIKGVVEKGVKYVTGLTLKIKTLNVGILNSYILIKDLRLMNPKGFKEKTMLSMPKTYVAYDLRAIMKRNIHLPSVRINVAEFWVIKNAEGVTNLDALKGVSEKKPAEEKEPEEKPAKEMPEIQIDSLELKVGKVYFRDYSKGGEPYTKEFNVDIDEKYTNVTNPNHIVRLIVLRSLMNTTISDLTNLNLKQLQSSLSYTLKSVTQMVTPTQVQESGQQAMDTTKKLVDEGTPDSVKQAAGEISGAITGLFGSKEE